MEISIVIPNLNSPIINQTIDSLLGQQTSRSFEIIIVGKDKFNLVEGYKDERVHFIKTDQPTPPAIARNIGVNAGKGALIIFIDADCIAANHFIEEHVMAHAGKEDKVIGGGVSLQPRGNYWVLSDNIATFHEILAHTQAGAREILPSLNLSLSRSLWNKLGGFDPTFPTAAGEDADFSFRARQSGADLIFTPKAIVEHRHQRASFTSLLNHAYTFGKFSTKFNPNYQRDPKATHFFLKIPFGLVLFSPILAFGVLFRIVFIERLPINYWHTLPTVLLAKFAWCFGAYKRMVEFKNGK